MVASGQHEVRIQSSSQCDYLLYHIRIFCLSSASLCLGSEGRQGVLVDMAKTGRVYFHQANYTADENKELR